MNKKEIVKKLKEIIDDIRFEDIQDDDQPVDYCEAHEKLRRLTETLSNEIG